MLLRLDSTIGIIANALIYRFSVAIMMDTEGSEVHTSELDQPMKAEVRTLLEPCVPSSADVCATVTLSSIQYVFCMQAGEEFILTIRNPQNVDGPAIGVSYDAFVDDVQVGVWHPSH